MAEHKKIGIMGGTFNPIHFGHLLLAETAFHQFNLDEILIMPTKNPYYKKISNSVTEEDRVAMVEPVSYTHLDVYKRQVIKLYFKMLQEY